MPGVSTVTDLLRTTVEEFLNGIVGALPSILSGLLFLALAYVFVRVLRLVLRSSLERLYPADQKLVVDFAVLVVTVFVWFGVGLVFLKVLGMGDIASSLGTAVGFIALGVSYALSEMVEDTVAGIYLLRDPDFNPGDTVTAADTTGTVTDIGLRKSRFRLENGDRTIIANRDVESNWTKRAAGEGTRPRDVE